MNKFMFMKFKIILLFVFVFFFGLVFSGQAQEKNKDEFFKAQVLEVLDVGFVNGESVRQKLELVALDGTYANEEMVFEEDENFEVLKRNIYKEGDIVLAVASFDDEGNREIYVTDYVRSKSLIYLLIFFVLSIVVVGGLKGLRSLISLGLTFSIIIYFIIPKILDGNNALVVTLIGSLFILLTIIYVTEGFNRKSHLAVFIIFVSLVFTVVLSWIFVELSKLSGLVGEESFFLIEIVGQAINFKGLLLAGIVIGALGVLDDVVISQIATVEQLYFADKMQSKKEVFKKAYKVGVSHISSMTNTLFLAYAGASFSLLILFLSGGSAFNSFFDIINNEAIATEIVRTLAGSIGLILSVPIATWMAVLFLRK
jgi:uncharacterized membrane protein